MSKISIDSFEHSGHCDGAHQQNKKIQSCSNNNHWNWCIYFSKSENPFWHVIWTLFSAIGSFFAMKNLLNALSRPLCPVLFLDVGWMRKSNKFQKCWSNTKKMCKQLANTHTASSEEFVCANVIFAWALWNRRQTSLLYCYYLYNIYIVKILRNRSAHDNTKGQTK